MTAPPDGSARRLVLLWSILLLAVGGLVAAIFWRAPKRPTYEGKTAEEWLLLCDPTRRMEDDPAWNALLRMGADALPDLERILSGRPKKRHGQWTGWMIRLQLTKPDPFNVIAHELNYRAARAAHIIAEKGNVDIRPLVPALKFHFTNSIYGEFSRALARAGDEGIAVLTNHLFTGQLVVRRQAAFGLQFVNHRPQSIAALLRSANVETNSGVRADAYGALAGSGAPAELVVPLGLRFLRSDEGYTRWQAVDVLIDYRCIVEVSNALQAALSDPDVLVRRAAAHPARR